MSASLFVYRFRRSICVAALASFACNSSEPSGTVPGARMSGGGGEAVSSAGTIGSAGTTSPEWTDVQAKALAADSSVNQNVTYLGQFKLDSTKNEVMSDSCHASSPAGENKLGEQAKAFFGG